MCASTTAQVAAELKARYSSEADANGVTPKVRHSLNLLTGLAPMWFRVATLAALWLRDLRPKRRARRPRPAMPSTDPDYIAALRELDAEFPDSEPLPVRPVPPPNPFPRWKQYLGRFHPMGPFIVALIAAIVFAIGLCLIFWMGRSAGPWFALPLAVVVGLIAAEGIGPWPGEFGDGDGNPAYAFKVPGTPSQREWWIIDYSGNPLHKVGADAAR